MQYCRLLEKEDGVFFFFEHAQGKHARRADMIWRGAHPYPGHEWLPEIRQLRVEVT